MKNLIIGLIIGITVCLSFKGITPPNEPVIYKPALPKNVVTYCGMYPSQWTKSWSDLGYIVTATASQGYYNTYVVMCKY